jgi:hypothetical protein
MYITIIYILNILQLNMSSKYVITITYGERVENHAGNQMI